MTALNIEVHGKPDSLRANARWLQARSEDVHAAGTGIRQARTGSEAGWGGVAGPAFRTTMSAVGPKVDGLSDDFTGTGRALESHADDLDTVRSRMAQARQIASAAGLRVSDTEITAPGPPPPTPQRLDPGKCYAPDVQRAHDEAVTAQNAYGTKVVAYHQATETVLEARRIETNSQNTLTKFLGDVADPKKAPLTITDFGSGLVAAHLEGPASSAQRPRSTNGESANSAGSPTTRACRYRRSPTPNAIVSPPARRRTWPNSRPPNPN